MKSICRTNQFKKDVRKAERRGKNLEKLKEVIVRLSQDEGLPIAWRDHELTGECKRSPRPPYRAGLAGVV
ncbi:MAG: type II toxin-antitoxin system mRNA interferase toxin, RelE/StbE family [Rhodothermales bacterium]|nr:type II toxin-antitoxin system mRNA interferase toxin, RelE/StbE family [Rhodothermales bacterium]